MRRAPYRICPKPSDVLLWTSSPRHVSLLVSWMRSRRCWSGRGLKSAETDAAWVYEMREMLTDGEHFLDFINLSTRRYVPAPWCVFNVRDVDRCQRQSRRLRISLNAR